MSYKLFFDEYEMDIRDIGRLAQTKQVNNIVNLHTRQTNATNNFSLPKSAKNIKNLKLLGVIGNTSNRPYEKISANLLDTVTGEWLIYKGWAVISETNKDFKVAIFDGVIDFFKQIDNKKLHEIDISGLNHLKTMQAVIDSWQNNLPYMYIISDFNGKTYTTSGLNIDYQVPSARVSYIWERIHEYAGFTYSGSIFQTEKFTNWFMTFPKPITDASIQVIPITAQPAIIVHNQTPNGMFSNVEFLPNTVPTNPYMTKNAQNQLVAYVSGSYKIKVTGVATNNSTNTEFKAVNYSVVDASNTLLLQGSIDGSANGFVYVPINAGEKIYFYSSIYGGPGNWIVTNQQIFVDYVDGYVANFDEALIDFTASEFYKEVLNHFALIPFKDKYSNHIVYKNLAEIMQNEQVVDWSNKNPEKLTEKYIVGTYGQANFFQYKYNQEGESHSDGAIYIDNKNLKETNTAIQSKFYAPNQPFELFDDILTFPIWERELDTNGQIQYKELTGRYYVHRYRMDYTTMTLHSELLNIQQTYAGAIPVSYYYRMRWSDIILDNYEDISKILNTSKIIEANLYLSSKDVNDFDFQRLVYIEQFSSYFIVNRIMNFIKDKYTKVELIEVDYFIEGEQEEVAPYTYITITDVVMNGCTMTITIDTDANYPEDLILEVYQTYQPIIGNAINTTDAYTVTANGNVLTFTYTGYVITNALCSIKLWLGTNNIFFGIPSNEYSINLSNCQNPVNGTYITYNSNVVVEYIPGFLGQSKKLQVFFTTDVPLPVNVRFWYADVYGTQNYQDVFATTNNFQVIVPHSGLFGTIALTTWLQIGNLVSNQLPAS